MRSLTTGDVRNDLIPLGWELISEYRSSRIKIEVKCCKGHVSSLFLHNIRKGQRCSQCHDSQKTPSCRWRTRKDRAVAEFKKRGFILLTKKYRNKWKPLHCRCSTCGQKTYIKLADLLCGKQCNHA